MSIVPFLPLIGGALDFLGKRSQAKRQNALEMQKYANLRKAAEAGGFHPLAVLQSGGSVNMQAGPRLLTSLSQSNAFDALEAEYTGEAAKARDRQNVRDEIERLEMERLKHDVAQQHMTRPTIGPSAGFSNKDDDEFYQMKENPVGLVKTEHGAVVETWEGPDPFEMAMGWVNAKRSDAKAAREWEAKKTRMPQRPIDVPRSFWTRGRPPSEGKILQYNGMTWKVISGNRMIQIVERPAGGKFSG